MEYRLEVRSVSKRFPGVRALDNVSLAVAPGEVHAVVGENGAGKSTLMKILAGVVQPDAGELIVRGRPVRFTGPQAARTAGINMIYQEPTLVPVLSVAENIFLGSEVHGPAGVLNKRRMEMRAREVLAQLGVVDLDVRLPVEGLTVAQKQLVEVARALATNCDVLILDEPTAALTDHEVQGVFNMVRALRARGVSILYISHRLDEVFVLADRVTVLKDGRHVATLSAGQTTKRDLVRLMVGREVADIFPPRSSAHGDVVLSVRGLTRAGRFRNISFDLRRGEIVGLFGLVGAGRSEVARAICGVDRFDVGEIRLSGERVSPRSPADALRHGIAMLTEDRKADGLFQSMGVVENITIASLRRWQRAGFLQAEKELQAAATAIQQFNIHTSDFWLPVQFLSGGNQQKVLLARWLLSSPTVLILDEPTRGVDVGAKAEIYALIRRCACEGMAVLLISSDLPEVLGLSDRILVMRSGELVGELPANGASEEAVMLLAAHVA